MGTDESKKHGIGTIEGEGAIASATNNGIGTITLASEPQRVVSVVKVGAKSGKVGVDFALPDEISEADVKAINIRLRKAGLPLVVLGASHEVAHVRTGLTKDASECHFWVTPDSARKSKIQGR